jgi:hypothetical protein
VSRSFPININQIFAETLLLKHLNHDSFILRNILTGRITVGFVEATGHLLCGAPYVPYTPLVRRQYMMSSLSNVGSFTIVFASCEQFQNHKEVKGRKVE